ncbi:MAG: cell division protein FtsZ [Candidatus Jorgensenbacteria bacterium]|nr:cell division protein FtsZ [Candidatus Jorgensenbacteria bacterium]
MKKKKVEVKKIKPKQVSAPTSQPASAKKKISQNFARIKVIGVGGGGGNAISRMMNSDRIRGVQYIAINTDAQDLDYASAHKKIYIGKALTKGLGAGMNPEIGKQAAEENRSEIGEELDDADIVFVTAGLGGGTGSGAGPVVAEIAKEKGILTVGIVTRPFMFEGAQRAAIANEALGKFKEKVDALVVIPNDRVFGLIDKDTSLIKAYSFIDEVLKNGVKSLSELINTPGLINVDFADVKAILRDAGQTLIGIGIAGGQDRSIKAANLAINSPLLEVSIDGARNVLFSIAGGRDVKMSEVNDIARAVASNLDANARVIFGVYNDNSLKDKSIKVTVIATGFNGTFSTRIVTPTLFMMDEIPSAPKATEPKEKTSTPTVEKDKTPKNMPDEHEESWDIPAFLRKKKK